MKGDGASLGAIAIRVACLLAALAVAVWAAHVVRDAVDFQIRPDNEQQVHRMLMVGLVAYIGLMAIPFVPGAEIGLAMLATFGAAIVPLIYVATVTSMTLAYTIGRFLPIGQLERLLRGLRMRRAADLVARAAPLSREERLRMLLEGRPSRWVERGLRYRYLALAGLLNLPGNSVLGGGGGIMMMAGLSGLFSPVATLLTIAIAVSPVPLAVLFMGFQL